jgi:hypothetical protein
MPNLLPSKLSDAAADASKMQVHRFASITAKLYEIFLGGARLRTPHTLTGLKMHARKHILIMMRKK